jgi:uncharacterized membrane protein
MSMQTSQTLDKSLDPFLARKRSGRHLEAKARAQARSHAESLQRVGTRTIAVGSVITIVGIVLYCIACFAGGIDADLGDILFRNSVPFARTTLAVVALGTVVWLVGSLTYLRGAMDAEDDTAETPAAQDR